MDVLPRPLLLGVATEAQARGFAWDILGLSTIMPFPFFPINIGEFKLVLALPREMFTERACTLTINFWSTLSPAAVASVQCDIKHSTSQDRAENESMFVAAANRGPTSVSDLFTADEHQTLGPRFSSTYLLPVPLPPFYISQPSTLVFECIFGDLVFPLGHVNCLFAQTPPLSDDEINELLLRADKCASVIYRISCGHCPDKAEFVYYVGDKQHLPQNAVNAIPIWSAPEEWTCACNKTTVPLNYLKLGMHEALRHRSVTRNSGFLEISTIAYRQYQWQGIVQEYRKLIQSNCDEESVHRFLNKNKIFWLFLAPRTILSKPRLLVEHVADFAILGTDGILYIIELEKPETKLFRQDGRRSAEVQAGLDQINAWKVKFEDCRNVILKEMKIDERRVNNIKYILVAGLSVANETAKMREIRASLAPDVQILTFDDLLNKLISIQHGVAAPVV